MYTSSNPLCPLIELFEELPGIFRICLIHNLSVTQTELVSSVFVDRYAFSYLVCARTFE